MKLKFQLLFISLLLITLTCFNSCKKDTPSDPADQFVKSYNYTITSPELGFMSGDMKVTKISANKISVFMTGGTPTPYTVSGNAITEDAGQIVDLLVGADSTASFTENSTGILVENVLTINGTWSNPDFATLSFRIVATKK